HTRATTVCWQLSLGSGAITCWVTGLREFHPKAMCGCRIPSVKRQIEKFPGPACGNREGAHMKLPTALGLAVALGLLVGTVGPRAAACDPVGNVRFVCGQLGPEDLAVVSGGEWVLSSGMTADGAIRAISLRHKTTTVLFPTATPKERLDKKTYASCPGPIDLTQRERFRAHGLYLRPGRS